MKNSIDLICSGTGGSFLSMAGAYKALTEHGFEIRRCACTSGSAITMSFLVGLGFSPDSFLQLCREVDFRSMIRFRFFHPVYGYIYDNSPMLNWIDKKTGGATLKDCKIDVFCVNATDINTGEMFIFSNLNEPDMKFADAIAGTTAIPGLFPPLHYKNRYFVDGGVQQNLLIGVFDDMKVRMKIALLEMDEQSVNVDISSKMRETITDGNGPKPGILKNTVKSIHFLMNALLEAQLREKQNTITIEVPAVKTKDRFYLSDEEKVELYSHAYKSVSQYLQENV